MPPLCNLPPANPALSPHPRFQTSYPLSNHYISSPSAPHHRPLLLAILLLLPLTLSGFFIGILEVFEPGALNCFTMFHPILSTLSACRNPILTHVPLYGFLDYLLCILITPTSGLAFSHLIPHTLAAALSFSSGMAYLSLNFLSPLFLCLISTVIM